MIFGKINKSKLNCVIATTLILAFGTSIWLVFTPYEVKNENSSQILTSNGVVSSEFLQFISKYKKSYSS